MNFIEDEDEHEPGRLENVAEVVARLAVLVAQVTVRVARAVACLGIAPPLVDGGIGVVRFVVDVFAVDVQVVVALVIGRIHARKKNSRTHHGSA